MSGGPPLWLLLSLINYGARAQGRNPSTKGTSVCQWRAGVVTNEDSQSLHMGTLHAFSASRRLSVRLTILSKVRTAMPVGPFDR